MCFGDFARSGNIGDPAAEFIEQMVATYQNQPIPPSTLIVHPKDYLSVVSMLYGEDSPQYAEAAAACERMRQAVAELDDMGIQLKGY
jgi:hypothetical protein